MKKYSPVIIFLALFSCESIVDIDVPHGQPQLTVNAIFNPDSLWSATIKLNRYILNDSPYQKVDNALVIICQDNSPIDTLEYKNNGFYKSKSRSPETGKNYDIRVIANSYKSIVAHSYTPSPTQILSIDLKDVRSISDFPNNTIQINFKDDPAIKNFYQITNIDIETEEIDYRTGKIVSVRVSNIPVFPDNPALQNYLNVYEGVLMNDMLFNGKDAEVSVKTRERIQQAGWCTVYLRTVTEDFYNYYTTAQLQNDISKDPLAQPINVSGNIENGFGIFSGYSQSSFTHTNTKPIIKSIYPLQGSPGDTITITGENLSEGSVLFKGESSLIYARTINKNQNVAEFLIPEQAITGNIYFRSNGRIAISDDAFEIIE